MSGKAKPAASVGSSFRNRSYTHAYDANGNAVDGSGVPSQYVRKRVYGLGPTLEANYDNTAASGAADWKLKKVRLYVSGPDGMIGAREFDVTSGTAGTEQALVYHHDHLGSTQSITPWGVGNALAANATGESGRYSEDPWGARRNPFTWTGVPPADTDNGGAQGLTPRGFTSHEMLDDLGLVHMNGRIYDPLLGRFLSADVLIDGPLDLQGYNRYSYVKNRPLSAIDPTGFFKIPIHKRITENAFAEAKTDKGIFGAFKADVVLGATITADIVNAAADRHFDGRQNFKEVQDTWGKLNDRIDNTLQNIGPVNQQLGGHDAEQLGLAIHNVQDFYSHSNYAELYVEYYKETHEGEMPETVPTYNEGLKDEKFKERLEGNLRTGDFDLVSNEFTHIGDDYKEPTSHNAMNKDKADTPVGKLAEKTATQHTAEILRKIDEEKEKKK